MPVATIPKGAKDVIAFWFDEHGPEDWFIGKSAFDAEVAIQFGATHEALARGEGFTWRQSPEGRLAEIIVLDQFSRQLYRDDGRAFIQDLMALALAQEAVAAGLDHQLPLAKRSFLYMPYMHAESLVVHEEAMKLFGAMEGENWLKFEIGHFEAIKRFGRFPKRNWVLNRPSTPEELVYLAEIGNRAF